MNSTFINDGNDLIDASGIQERNIPKRTLRSMTIKQLFQITGGIIDNTNVTTISIVGFVRELTKTNTGLNFKLFDTTEIIDINFWPNGNYDESLIDSIHEGYIVKIIGTLRLFNDKKIVVCNVFKVVDGNYLIYHLINAAYQKKMLTTTENKTTTSANANIETEILNLIKENQSNMGIHIDTIIAMLGNDFEEKEIILCINNLKNNKKLIQEGENYMLK